MNHFDRFQGLVEMALDNLELAERLAIQTVEMEKQGQTMSAHVQLSFPGGRIEIPGTREGFFTVPVMHCAMLDVRRILEFLRIGLDKKTGGLKEIPGASYPDDMTIIDFGLPAVRIDQLESLSFRTVGRAPYDFLRQIVSYTNKEMAHFTKTESQPTLESMISGFKLVKAATNEFVYDALNKPRPISKLIVRLP